MSDNSSIIVTDKLSKRFDKINALDSLTIQVKKGTTFGYLGPNGAGKTTTVRILTGLLRPTSGNAVVCGYNVHTQRNEIRL